MSIISPDTPARYLVGIDLGTTNSAVAYVDSSDERWRVRAFAVPQLVAPAEVEPRETLPSFHYEAAPGEFPTNAMGLPWDANDRNWAVGIFARDHGAAVPGRLITSAKSWLCHSGVDRTADLLPWHGAPDAERLSPVEVSSRYLEHIRQAWDFRFPAERLAEQDVVLTLPASFDEVARELTVRAAKRAGLPRVVLVEEPQAAFYAWIHAQGDDWERLVRPGQKILVCDIGGGTSDFTLIRVRRGEGGKVAFHRVAVGEHLILGGDNLDLALAHHIEHKLAGDGKLQPRQWAVLVRACRQVKETLLADEPPERYTLSLPGSGSQLIGGALQIEVTREEVQEVLVEGFLPRVRLDERPIARRSGFQEFGLPYASDAAMTRYLAAFLTAHRHVAEGDGPLPADHDPVGRDPADHDPALPDLVLFNGGFFASPLLRNRLLSVLGSWGMAHGDWTPHVLANERLDLAVAQGAAYYGMVRRGVGVRISAGLARTYYVGVESAETSAASAVCLLPAQIEEGHGVDLTERPFELLIRQPVEFPLYVSSTRLTDRPGELFAFDPEQMTALPPIRTVFEAGKKGPSESIVVYLHARLSEIGTLDLWAGEIQGSRTWRLQFDVRAATQTDREGHRGAGEAQGVLDDSLVAACRESIRDVFAPASLAPKPESLVKRLEERIGMSRREWPMSFLRSLWESLVEVEPGRRRSAEHEARWMYLLGFALRPGYGLAVDDWRVQQTWRLLQGKRAYHTPACRTEWWILWRRIAGGLTPGQQGFLAEPLLAALRPPSAGSPRGGKSRPRDLGAGSHETAEVWRLLGSFELLRVAAKVELAHAILGLIAREKVGAVRDAGVWAVGRLGARVPMYGPLNTVVPADDAARWLQTLRELGLPDESVAFCLVQLARRTGDRHRDLPDKLREQVLAWLDRVETPPHYRQLVAEGGELQEQEAGLMFGESLPRGLRVADNIA
ncbi:MAG TPA: Hsp70 family protein [Pirellulales bacterium]|nr:Hsp70 family protein [Pirellulales bacterium]